MVRGRPFEQPLVLANHHHADDEDAVDQARVRRRRARSRPRRHVAALGENGAPRARDRRALRPPARRTLSRRNRATIR